LTPFGNRFETAAAAIFQNTEEGLTGRAAVQQPDNMVVAQMAGDFDLAKEHLPGMIVDGDLGQHDFDGDGLSVGFPRGFLDRPMPPLPWR